MPCKHSASQARLTAVEQDKLSESPDADADAMAMSLPSTPPPASPQTFPFDRLLPEIQLLVLEASLPRRRIFHVRDTYKVNKNNNKHSSTSSSSSLLSSSSDATSGGGFRFHIRHPPPPMLAVCRTTREAILRRGVFLDGPHGAWFNPEIDMLYFDRNQRHSFRSSAKRTTPTTSPWAAIQHVGLEWRAFFSRTPRLAPGDDMGSIWREALAPLRASMPRLQTVTYVLPMVRHAGGLTWGREPYGASRFEAELVALPDETNVPWGDSLILDAVMPGQNRGAGQVGVAMAELLDGRRSYLVPWGDIKEIIDGSLNIEEEDEDEDGEIGGVGGEVDWREVEEKRRMQQQKKKDLPKLDLTGCWLLRMNASYDEEVSSFPS